MVFDEDDAPASRFRRARVRACVYTWVHGYRSLSKHGDEELTSTGNQTPLIQATASMKSYETVRGTVFIHKERICCASLQLIRAMTELHASKVTTLSDITRFSV